MTRTIQVAILCCVLTLGLVAAVSLTMLAMLQQIVAPIIEPTVNEILLTVASIEGGSIDALAFETNVCLGVRSRSPPHVRA